MTTTPLLFHSLTYADADRGLAFLSALGFAEVLVVRNEADPAIVEHAQLAWREHGGVMLGSVRPDNPHTQQSMVGQARCYLVVPTDADVDATFARAIQAGGTSIEEPSNQPYGGRVATVADPEGNHWSFGSYAGE
ncbi:VOC family protein [Kytococcus sedentarius]|uniref:VOC family protein n=1 Tax=Kytococcus sedentarius TaxID=1276 RepID=UPI00384D960D